jgi:hypothetical protein
VQREPEDRASRAEINQPGLGFLGRGNNDRFVFDLIFNFRNLVSLSSQTDTVTITRAARLSSLQCVADKMEISCRGLCHKELDVDKEGSLAYGVEAGFDETTLSLLDDIDGILADMDDACNDSRTPPPTSVLLPRFVVPARLCCSLAYNHNVDLCVLQV